MTCRFRVYECKYGTTPRSILAALWPSFPDTYRTGKTARRPAFTFPAEVEQGDALPSGFHSPAVNKCPFHGLLSAAFFTFLCLFMVILQLKMTPRRNAEVPSGVPRHQQAGTCPVSIRPAAFRHHRRQPESDVSESTVHIA